jgi:transposase InsO family protein
VAYLQRALAWFSGLGVTVERVMTDNRPRRGRSVAAGACAARRTRGSAYVSRAFREACEAARVKHKRTRPYTPKTNGKAERFIQTSLREWAYPLAFASSAERAGAMRPRLHAYDRHRPHSALGGKPPLTRLPRDNLHSNDR